MSSIRRRSRCTLDGVNGNDGPGDIGELGASENPEQRTQPGQSALLSRFAQGDGEQIGIAVGVAAELQPFAELAMMREQHPGAIGADDPRRTGQVPRKARAPEAGFLRFDKADGLLRHRALVRIAGPLQVIPQKRKNGRALRHGKTRGQALSASRTISIPPWRP